VATVTVNAFIFTGHYNSKLRKVKFYILKHLLYMEKLTQPIWNSQTDNANQRTVFPPSRNCPHKNTARTPLFPGIKN
jgi:hypothetical protein